MLRALVTSGSYTANTNIPLTVDTMTNTKAVVDSSNNTIRLRTCGLRDVKANIVFTPTSAGDVTLTMYANGVAIPGAVYTTSVATSGTATFIINDVVRVIKNLSGDIANISFQLNVAGTLPTNAGAVIVEHLS